MLLVSHDAQLRFGSCQESHERAHKAQKVILKRKRARAFVTGAQKHAVSAGKLRRLRKLRVIRRTRFNSRVQVLDSFLLNTPLMRKVIAAPAFAATMQADNARKQKRVDEAMKAWSHDATYHRARRALIVGAPCAVPPQLTGKLHVSGLSVILELRPSLVRFSRRGKRTDLRFSLVRFCRCGKRTRPVTITQPLRKPTRVPNVSKVPVFNPAKCTCVRYKFQSLLCSHSRLAVCKSVAV